MRIAVLDDWQGVSERVADWSQFDGKAEVTIFRRPIPPSAVENLLGDFEILLPLRERMAFPAEVIASIPKLRMMSLTGRRNRLIDFDALDRRGIVYSFTQSEAESDASAAELALALMLAAAKHIPAANAAMHAGRFQEGVPLGISLRGRTAGIIGLGRLGQLMAGYCRALGMKVLAWSPNLTDARASEAGVEYADKSRLLTEADVISLHMVLGPSTRGMIGKDEIAQMRSGCILVNTSRGALIDKAAMLLALHEERIRVALDVYDSEPVPSDDPILSVPNAILTPHIGYCVDSKLRNYYSQAIGNIVAFLEGRL